MTMTDTLDRGDEKDWADLDSEESRCLVGLIKYWKVIEEKDEQTAAMLAWDDIQREKPRLVNFKWFKGNS